MINTAPFLSLIGMFLATVYADAQDVASPLINAHAHNDYYHETPLRDALEQGFCSVEADVFLHRGELYVAHSFSEIKEKRTLDKLYLHPLQEIVNENQQSQPRDPPAAVGVFPKSAGFQLLIDFKSEAKSTLAALQNALEPYHPMLTRYHQGKIIPGAVTIVISGNRPIQQITKAPSRYVFLDGRLADGKEITAEIAPIVSESWNTHFEYRGVGEMTDKEKNKLDRIVDNVHEQGKRIRFWALPDRPQGWQVALDAQVDLINTDKLKALRTFLLQQQIP